MVDLGVDGGLPAHGGHPPPQRPVGVRGRRPPRQHQFGVGHLLVLPADVSLRVPVVLLAEDVSVPQVGVAQSAAVLRGALEAGGSQLVVRVFVAGDEVGVAVVLVGVQVVQIGRASCRERVSTVV